MAKFVSKKQGQSWESGANLGTSLACRRLEAALTSLPEVINFHHVSKSFYPEKFVGAENFPFSVPISDYTYMKVIPICTTRKV